MAASALVGFGMYMPGQATNNFGCIATAYTALHTVDRRAAALRALEFPDLLRIEIIWSQNNGCKRKSIAIKVYTQASNGSAALGLGLLQVF